MTDEAKRPCKGCRFEIYLGAGHVCDYLGVTGHMRGCPPGKGCLRRETMRTVKGKWNILGRKGRWVGLGCPFCGDTLEADETVEKDDVHYCVRCGARLDWEDAAEQKRFPPEAGRTEPR